MSISLQQEDGQTLVLESKPARIVSLVPSITENLILFGVTPIARTSFCIEPRGEVERIPTVGGTKTPTLKKIAELRPDLVIANKEENIKDHVEELKKQGIPVWTTYPITLEETVYLMQDLQKICGFSEYSNQIIKDAKDMLSQKAYGVSPCKFTFAVPIWKDPWMVAGVDTYINHLLSFVGGENVFSDSRSRYPEVTEEEIVKRAPNLVILPSEPYEFREEHMEELEKKLPNSFITRFSGEDICWPGPRMLLTINELKKIRQEFL